MVEDFAIPRVTSLRNYLLDQGCGLSVNGLTLCWAELRTDITVLQFLP